MVRLSSWPNVPSWIWRCCKPPISPSFDEIRPGSDHIIRHHLDSANCRFRYVVQNGGGLVFDRHDAVNFHHFGQHRRADP
jgi:hypothetical protein